jgi:hypothetical protein
MLASQLPTIICITQIICWYKNIVELNRSRYDSNIWYFDDDKKFKETIYPLLKVCKY